MMSRYMDSYDDDEPTWSQNWRLFKCFEGMMYNLKKRLNRWLFDILASLIILFSCIVGFTGVFILSFFLTSTDLHPFFIWLILLIGVYFVFYIHYKVTKYLELFEKKDKSVKDKEIDTM